MSEKHLKKGDPLPPLAKDTLRIYSMKFCPYAQRTRLVLAHKKIPHEVVNINLQEKPDWFLEKNPVGTVPTLEYNDKILWESNVCDDFLDEVYKDHPLNHPDPFQKAKLRILVERWGKVVTQFYKMLFNTAEVDQVRAEIEKLLPVFEEAITDKYFGGPNVGMVDLTVWPHMERLYNAQEEGSEKVLGDFKTKFPRLSGWIARMLEEPAVKATYTTPARQHRFLQGVRAKKTEYDF